MWQNRHVPIATYLLMLHKHNNAFVLSAMAPDTTVDVKLRFPMGAPVFDAYETEIENGEAIYRFPKAEHTQCRVFVEQENGVVGVKEEPPVNYRFRRKIKITGLKNATVRFFGEEYCKNDVYAMLNPKNNSWEADDSFEWNKIESEEFGTYWEAKNISGTLMVAMPNHDKVKNEV